MTVPTLGSARVGGQGERAAGGLGGEKKRVKKNGHAAEYTPTLIRALDLIGHLSCPSASLASHWLQGIPLAS